MEYSLIIESFSKHIFLSEEEKEALRAAFQYKKVKKKQTLMQYGDTANKTFFVNSGILRMYAVDKNGFEHNIQFAPKGWWITDIQSLTKQTPATLFIDAIEDSEVLFVRITELKNLLDKYPAFERYFRILAENSLASYQQRFANSLSLSAKERYGKFCELYPDLILQLPQKQIASYIGVTPEFLSKMLSVK